MGRLWPFQPFISQLTSTPPLCIYALQLRLDSITQVHSAIATWLLGGGEGERLGAWRFTWSPCHTVSKYRSTLLDSPTQLDSNIWLYSALLHNTTTLYNHDSTQLDSTLLDSTQLHHTTILYHHNSAQLDLTRLDSTRLDSTTQLYTITTQLDLIRLDYSRVDSTLPDSTPLDSTNTYTGLFPTLTRLDWTQLDSTTKLYTITT